MRAGASNFSVQMPKSKKKKELTPKIQQEESFTEEQLSEIVDFRARKLGVFLLGSSLPDDVKEAWITLLPEMTLEQVDRLTDILEAEYLSNATAEIDDYFKKRWEGYLKEFAAESIKHETEFSNKTDALEKVRKELE